MLQTIKEMSEDVCGGWGWVRMGVDAGVCVCVCVCVLGGDSSS